MKKHGAAPRLEPELRVVVKREPDPAVTADLVELLLKIFSKNKPPGPP